MLKFWSLFSGVGLLDIGFAQAGIEHVLFCESDPWRREIIAKRWPGVPICADIRKLRAGDAEPPDGVVGGFPCRGISSAGRQEGFDHPETVLWREMARVVGELRPRYIVLENVANLLTLKKGLVWQEVLETLASLGFDVVWDCIPASALYAPHKRDRVFAVAVAADAGGGSVQLRRGPGAVRGAARAAEGEGDQRERGGDAVADRAEAAADADRGRQPERQGVDGAQWDDALGRGARVEWGVYQPAIRRWEAIHGPAPEPLFRRMDDGNTKLRRMRARLDRHRLSALGDGVQVYVARIVGEYVVWLDQQQRLQQKEREYA